MVVEMITVNAPEMAGVMKIPVTPKIWGKIARERAGKISARNSMIVNESFARSMAVRKELMTIFSQRNRYAGAYRRRAVTVISSTSSELSCKNRDASSLGKHTQQTDQRNGRCGFTAQTEKFPCFLVIACADVVAHWRLEGVQNPVKCHEQQAVQIHDDTISGNGCTAA